MPPCPISRRLLALIAVLFPIAWGASSALALYNTGVGATVYVVSPWPENSTPLAGACEGGSILVVASNRSGFKYDTLIYDARGPRWLVLKGFQAQAACIEGSRVAVAGSYLGLPALAIADLGAGNGGVARIYSVPRVRYASFSVIDCSGGSIAAAGLAPEGVLVLLIKGGLGRALLLSYSSPLEALRIIGGSIYIVTPTALLEIRGAKAYTIDFGDALPNSTVEEVTVGPQGLPWVVGMTGIPGEGYWGLIAPLEGGLGIALRSRGHAGLALDAYWDGYRWLVYYRPGTFWDSIVEITPIGGSGVELLWSGSHEVLVTRFTPPGVAIVVTEAHLNNATSLVLSCINSLQTAHYWVDDRPVMHIAPIPVPERIETFSVHVRRPPMHSLVEEAIGGANETLVKLETLGAGPAPLRATARGEEGLLAATYISLSLVFASLAWRGFGECRV